MNNQGGRWLHHNQRTTISAADLGDGESGAYFQNTQPTRLHVETMKLLRGYVLPVLLLTSLTAGGCSESLPEQSEDEIERSVVSYLMARNHGGSTIEEQLYPDVNPVLFDPETMMIYFSLQQSLCDAERRKEIMAPYVDSVDRVWWNRDDGERMWLGKYRGRLSEENGCVCRTSLKNLRIDPEREVLFPYSRTVVSVTLRELAESIDNYHIFGGKSRLPTVNRRDRNRRFFNFGAFVSKPGDPPIERLANDLMALIDGESTREAKIQACLDFVTEDLLYVDEEAEGGDEVPKRSIETLMHGEADCGNKSILFASLLEQIDEDYLLVYTPGHHSIAVSRGAFSKKSKGAFQYEDTDWVLCETMTPGFQIGVDEPVRQVRFPDIEFIQRPRWENGMINPQTGLPPLGME